MEVRTFFSAISVILLSISCAQITPLHSARTEGAGNLTLTPTLDGTVVASSPSNAFGTQAFPGLRVELAYGLIDKLDILASLNSVGAAKASLKFQVYGDNYSNIAIAIMPGYEYQANIFDQGNQSQIQRIHFPLLLSIKGSGNTDFYAGPDLVLHIEDGSENNTILYGITGGLELGNRIKYNIGLGVFLPYSFNTSANGSLYQFGISARIPILRND